MLPNGTGVRLMAGPLKRITYLARMLLLSRVHAAPLRTPNGGG